MDDLKQGGLEGKSRPYLRFCALVLGVVGAMVVLGLIPTRHLAGDGALAAMIAGCAISTVGALIGTVPVMLARGQAAANTVPAVMLAIGLRLGAVVLLGFAAVWSGWFEAAPLLVWLVLSHAVLQVAEIRFTKQVLYT